MTYRHRTCRQCQVVNCGAGRAGSFTTQIPCRCVPPSATALPVHRGSIGLRYLLRRKCLCRSHLVGLQVESVELIEHRGVKLKAVHFRGLGRADGFIKGPFWE